MKISQKKIISLSLCTAFIFQMNLVAEDKKKSESLGSVDVVSSGSITSEGSGSYTFDRMKTSTKLDLSIKETPQSITVMTTQELKDKGITDYQTLLAHISGVSLHRYDERLKASARGFIIDYFKIDGVPTYGTYSTRDLDLSMYDRVEIVRGANGLTTGAGNPGISINLVRKKANQNDLTAELSVTTGSWDSYGLSLDVGSKLNEEGTVRGRIIAKHEQSDSYMDGYEKDNNLIYGMLEADLTDSTLLSVGASYQKVDKKGVRWGGLPAFDSNNKIISFDRSTIVSEDWTYLKTEEKSLFVDLKQGLFDDASLNLSYSHNEIIREDAFLYFYGKLNKSDGSGLGYYDWKSLKKNKEDNIDLHVDVPFTIGGLEQQIILGTSYNKDATKKYTGGFSLGSVPNFYNYDIAEPGEPGEYRKPSEITQKAIYLSGKFSLTEDLKLISGARMSSWKHTSEDDSVETREFKNEITPYVGLVYNLDDNHSIYTSYTSIFNPQDKKDKNSNYLDPIEGKSYEAGIKGEYFDGALNASLSIFKTKQEGIAEKKGKQISNPTADAYVAADEVTSKGFEIDLNGQLSEKLNLGFGLANFRAEDSDGKKFNTEASRTTANVFVKYDVNKDLSIGGGAQYKSKFYVEETLGTITQDAFFLFNAMASYDINKNTNIQLNVSNIFDEKYYEGIGHDSMVYGEPRKFTLNLNYKF